MINMMRYSRLWRRHTPQHSAGTTSGLTRRPAATPAAAGTAAAASSKETPDTRTRPALAVPTGPAGRPATTTATTRPRRHAAGQLARACLVAGVALALAALVLLELFRRWS